MKYKWVPKKPDGSPLKTVQIGNSHYGDVVDLSDADVAHLTKTYGPNCIEEVAFIPPSIDPVAKKGRKTAAKADTPEVEDKANEATAKSGK